MRELARPAHLYSAGKVAWAGGSLDIDPFVFAESADTLQTRILDAATPKPAS